jgi:hypothetical protein
MSSSGNASSSGGSRIACRRLIISRISKKERTFIEQENVRGSRQTIICRDSSLFASHAIHIIFHLEVFLKVFQTGSRLTINGTLEVISSQ